MSCELPIVSSQMGGLKSTAVAMVLLWATAGFCAVSRAASTAATNDQRHTAVELNPALRESGHLVSNSNLVGSLHEEERISPEEQIEMLYKLARQQHLRKNYEQAAKNLGTVLERDA